MKAWIILVFILGFLYFDVIYAEQKVSLLSKQGLINWKEKVFSGKTHYEIIHNEGKQALLAESQQSASALYYSIQIDLHKTPYLNWSWRVNNILQNLNEHKKAGDDYAARVYVVFGTGFMGLMTGSLNYVWANRDIDGIHWTSPYTGNVKLLAVQAGPKDTGKWFFEKRNVKDDIKKIFGKDVRYLKGVALMTDTDNSKQSAKAYYSDLFFSEN